MKHTAVRNDVTRSVITLALWLAPAILGGQDTLMRKDTTKVPSLTEVHLKEFEERRKFGLGHYITRAELARQRLRSMEDVLRVVPGVQVRRVDGHIIIASARGEENTSREVVQLGGSGAGVGTGPTSTRRTGVSQPRRPCYSDVFVDGLHVYTRQMDEALFDINAISPQSVEAIEVYMSPGQVPPAYMKGGSPCGAILLWMAEP